MPAGAIHALGPGIIAAEIQQNSDTTYRIFDRGRPRLDADAPPVQWNAVEWVLLPADLGEFSILAEADAAMPGAYKHFRELTESALMHRVYQLC